MSSFHDLSALARDAFVILQGAVEIKYRDGDVWRQEDAAAEHVIVHRLRAASLAALTEDPPDVEPRHLDIELVGQLREERRANAAMRDFLVALEALCQGKGMPKTVVGRNVLTWLGDHIGS